MWSVASNFSSEIKLQIAQHFNQLIDRFDSARFIDCRVQTI